MMRVNGRLKTQKSWAGLICLLGCIVLYAECSAKTFPAQVARIVISGPINPAVGDFIRENIERATDEQSLCLVIVMDTPGGLLNTTKSIVKDILGAPIPVIVYVAPSGSSAGSAGVFITMAGHLAVMAPGTTIGAAHPVASGGQNIEGDMRSKMENYAASFIESIAQRRGKNAEWAEKAVRESVSITEIEALEKQVIDLVATDIHDLLRAAQGKEIEVQADNVILDFESAKLANGMFRIVTIEMRLKHRVLNILAHPNVAYLLMMAGMLGIYLEFANPGLLFPGLAGGICLILALTAFQVLPINYTGLLLIGVGLCLLVAEMFLPSFGIVGAFGIAAFIFGSLFLFDTPDSEMQVDLSIVLSASLAVGIFMLLVGSLAVSAWRSPPALGEESLAGQIGRVCSPLAPRGSVWLHGEYWTAECDQEVAVGQKVEVVRVDRLVLFVRRVEG